MLTSRMSTPSWFEADLNIPVSASNDDIQIYINHRTQELRPLKANDREAVKQDTISDISNQVIKQSRGM